MKDSINHVTKHGTETTNLALQHKQAVKYLEPPSPSILILIA